MAFYARHLPHWQPADADFFVTWRLHGTLPGSASRKVDHVSAGSAFVAVDRELDAASGGPLWLKDPKLAECVSQVLLAGTSPGRLYELLAWVVMANPFMSWFALWSRCRRL